MCRRGLWLEKGDVARKAVVKVFALGAGARVDGGQRTKSMPAAGPSTPATRNAVVDAVARYCDRVRHSRPSRSGPR